MLNKGKKEEVRMYIKEDFPQKIRFLLSFRDLRLENSDLYDFFNPPA